MVADWSARSTDKTRPCCRFAPPSCLIARTPTALGEMRFPAPPIELGSAAAQAFSLCARPRITYRRTLDYVGDDRAANNVPTSVAPFFNPTNLWTNR